MKNLELIVRLYKYPLLIIGYLNSYIKYRFILFPYSQDFWDNIHLLLYIDVIRYIPLIFFYKKTYLNDHDISIVRTKNSGKYDLAS